ncbi:MAG: hypothetical protein H6Q88_3527, partial [Anaeromyxobacteraceae bacterium]|nr:hypothetical protein [Anaeromyxobacteraceae bacterium]
MIPARRAARAFLLLALLIGLPVRASAVAGPSGFDDWLGRADPAAAAVRFRADAVHAPSDPWPLLGEAMLAERSLDEDAEAGALLALVAGAPRHPLALVALRRLGELSLASPPVADRVDAALDRALGRTGLPGMAAYRARVVRAAIAEMRGAFQEAAGLRARNGVANTWTLAGPFGAYHALELDRPFPPEQGAWPPAGARPLPAPDGAFSLDGVSVPGDVWYVAADATLARGGRYLLAVGTTASIRVFLDGKPVAERRAWAGWPSAVQLARIDLPSGTHRFLVKLTRGSGRANLALTLARDDGSDADVTWAAATGPGPSVASAGLPETVLGARALADALEPEGGPVLARLVAARDRVENDRQAALALLDEAAGIAPGAAPVRAARGDALVGDPTLAERTAQGKAEAEWQEASRIDPGSAATRILLAGAAAAWTAIARAAPARIDARTALVRVLVAQGQAESAAAELADLARIWPADPQLQRRLGEVLELAGQGAAARAARERALALDGSDLALRRALALEDGREVLADLAVDGPATIRDYEAAKVPVTTPASLVLDAAAVEAWPDGSITERTHQVIHVHDARGVEKWGEVEVPHGATLLKLETRKRDGRILESEFHGGD